jgi:hypothetical protein
MPASSWWYFGRAGLVRAEQGYSDIHNQAMTGVAARWGLDSTASRGGVVAVGVLLLVLALVVSRRLHRAHWDGVAVTLVGVWSAVAAPLAWAHAFGWWVPLAIAIALTGRTRIDWLVAGVVVLLPYFEILGPQIEEGRGGILGDLRSANYVLLAAAVTAWLWWRVADRREASTPGSARAHGGDRITLELEGSEG